MTALTNPNLAIKCIKKNVKNDHDSTEDVHWKDLSVCLGGRLIRICQGSSNQSRMTNQLKKNVERSGTFDNDSYEEADFIKPKERSSQHKSG
jgi:hypothetical protein